MRVDGKMAHHCITCSGKIVCPLYRAGVRYVNGELTNKGDREDVLERILKTERNPMLRMVAKGFLVSTQKEKREKEQIEADKGKTIMKIEWVDKL